MADKSHEEVMGAHEERFKTIFNRLDTYDDHVREGQEYRQKVDKHDIWLNDIRDFRKELRVWAFGIIVVFIGGLLWMGGRIEVINKLERIHEKEFTQKDFSELEKMPLTIRR